MAKTDRTEKKRLRDAQGRFVSPVNGQPIPKGRPFTKGDDRAKQAAAASAASRKE